MRNLFAGRRLLGYLPPVLTSLAWLYALVIVYLAVVWTFLPDTFWWVSFANLFAPLCFLPALLFVVVACFHRTRRMILAAAIPPLVFALLFGPLFVPRLGRAAASNQPLRVLTFNHLFFNQQPDAVVAAIGDHGADVVALQELSPAVAGLIERDLSAQYPYRWLEPADNAGGLGIVSRYPILSREKLPDGRAFVAAIDVGGQPLTVVNVHLHFPGVYRRDLKGFGRFLPIPSGYDTSTIKGQVQNLIDDLESYPGPLVVMGDFNMGEREIGYRLMADQLRDAFRESGAGFGFTFPNSGRVGRFAVPLPLVRLDYVWLRGDLAASDPEIDCRKVGADHCMVKMDLAFVNK